MKKNFLSYAFLVAFSGVALLTSCGPDEPTKTTTPVATSNEVILSQGTIAGTRSLVNDSVYVLSGQVNVSGILNIEAGTIIKGDKATKGVLVVLPGGKINAIGTPSSPIVFTSRQAPGLRSAGDWGGIIICGKAITNQSSKTVEGLANPTVTYTGGTDDADNSGTLQYVRIEFAGIALEPDKETNGLTLCAVGSGTTIDHIQVSYGGDDSFEWFGGKVNAKYLISYLGIDDDFDTDYGFTGKVQYGLAVRNPRVADVSASNGFESDNDGSGTTATPKTAPIFSNMTIVGPYKTTSDGNINANFGAGMHIRRNSSLSIFNSVFAGWKTTGLLIDGTTTLANANAGNLVINNVCLIGTKGTAVTGSGADATSPTNTEVQTIFNTVGAGNSTVAANTTAGLETAFYLVSTGAKPTNFLPSALASLGTGSFTHAKFTGDSFFDKTPTFVGAFGLTDWTAEAWTNFDPQNTVY